MLTQVVYPSRSCEQLLSSWGNDEGVTQCKHWPSIPLWIIWANGSTILKACQAGNAAPGCAYLSKDLKFRCALKSLKWKGHALQIVEGSGKVLVVAVGVDSEWGKTMVLVATEAADTPLQESLGQLAAAIGKVGLAIGGLCFVVLMVRSGPHKCQPEVS